MFIGSFGTSPSPWNHASGGNSDEDDVPFCFTKPWLLRGNLPAILVCRVLSHENFANSPKKAIQEHTFFPEQLHSRSSRGACTDWSKISGVFVAVWQRPDRSTSFSRLSPTMSNATVTIGDCSCTSGIWHSSGSSDLSLDLLTTRN